ncbi:MAG: LCP family protein [Chloroflexota bacterium]
MAGVAFLGSGVALSALAFVNASALDPLTRALAAAIGAPNGAGAVTIAPAGAGPSVQSAQQVVKLAPLGLAEQSVAAGAKTVDLPPHNLLFDAIRPFLDQALAQREAREASEPDWFSRIDAQLNGNRLNFLLFGYSEEHGETYASYGGSPSILSYNLTSGGANSVSFTRDLYCPELRGRLANTPEVMRHVYAAGGFPLLRSVLEDASGLVMDYQAVLKDTLLAHLIDRVTGPITLDVQRAHDGGSFRVGGVEQAGLSITAGSQVMDGLAAMTFLESEDLHPVGRIDDRSYRKSALYSALARQMAQRSRDPQFLLALKSFVEQEVASGELQLDFPLNLTARALPSLLSLLGGLIGHQSVELVFPQLTDRQIVVISDPQFGDPYSGVSRVLEINRRAKAHAPSPATGQPDGPATVAFAARLPTWVQLAEGDPLSASPAQDYWGPVRAHVAQVLRQL